MLVRVVVLLFGQHMGGGWGFVVTTWTRGFYIFTIITDGAHQIIIFRMTPTSIPAERSLSYFFTTFADVVATAAGHASAESAVCQRRAPAVTARWTLCLILGTR